MSVRDVSSADAMPPRHAAVHLPLLPDAVHSAARRPQRQSTADTPYISAIIDAIFSILMLPLDGY